MAKVSLYLPLSQYLQQLKTEGKREVTLTFQEIESIIRRKLPNSARKYENWWINSYEEKGRQCSDWLDYHWIKKKVDLVEEKVFVFSGKINFWRKYFGKTYIRFNAVF